MKSYIYQNKGRMNLFLFRSRPIICKLNDFHVMGVTFHESENDRGWLSHCTGRHWIPRRSRRDYDSDMVDRWFTCSATLMAHSFRINGISEYPMSVLAEDALTNFGALCIRKDLDKHVEKLEKYCPQALKHPCHFPQGYHQQHGVDCFCAVDRRNLWQTYLILPPWIHTPAWQAWSCFHRDTAWYHTGKPDVFFYAEYRLKK